MPPGVHHEKSPTYPPIRRNWRTRFRTVEVFAASARFSPAAHWDLRISQDCCNRLAHRLRVKTLALQPCMHLLRRWRRVVIARVVVAAVVYCSPECGGPAQMPQKRSFMLSPRPRPKECLGGGSFTPVNIPTLQYRKSSGPRPSVKDADLRQASPFVFRNLNACESTTRDRSACDVEVAQQL